MSAGDRNALALAFFFASLDNDPDLNNKTIVIDDPMSSLDEHRSLTTIQEIRRLSSRVSQVILLSHSKPFLCGVWENANRNDRTALEITRSNNSSDLSAWNIHQDCITLHDKRHVLIKSYTVSQNVDNQRRVAEAIRPHLETFLRVAYPEHFPPGTCLGQFITKCNSALDNSSKILCEDDIVELNSIKEYGNRFHHDSDSYLANEDINDTELVGYANRALEFVKR